MKLEDIYHWYTASGALVAELPPKTETVIKVELSDWQKIVYNGVLKGKIARDPVTGKIGNQSLTNVMMALRQICNHPSQFQDHYCS